MHGTSRKQIEQRALCVTFPDYLGPSDRLSSTRNRTGPLFVPDGEEAERQARTGGRQVHMIFFVLPNRQKKKSNSQVQFFPILTLTVAFHRSGIFSVPYIPNCIPTKHEYSRKIKHPDLFSGLHIIYTFLKSDGSLSWSLTRSQGAPLGHPTIRDYI